MTTAGTKERGGCLTLYLVVIILFSIFGLVSAFSLNSTAQQLAAQGVAVNIPSWYAPAQILSVILVLVGAVGTWMWKKWGPYLLIANLVFGVVTALLAGQILAAVLAIVISGGILWYVLKDKWALFE